MLYPTGCIAMANILVKSLVGNSNCAIIVEAFIHVAEALAERGGTISVPRV